MKISKMGHSFLRVVYVGAAILLPATLKAQTIYVVNSGNIGAFGLDGSTINASLITGLNGPGGFAISGNDIFVANFGNGTIGEYTTSGATVNASLVSGLDHPRAIAVSGGDIFVANEDGGVTPGTIGEYTTSGATVNASLVSGLNFPFGVAVYGNDLFVSSLPNGTVGEYTTSGATINASLISGLFSPTSIVVVPEPGALALWGLGGLFLVRRYFYRGYTLGIKK